MPSYLFSKQQEKLERSPFLIQKSTIILVKEEGAEKFGEKEEYKEWTRKNNQNELLQSSIIFDMIRYLDLVVGVPK